MNHKISEPMLSQVLAEFVVNARFQQLDQKTVVMTRYALLDGLGVSIAASTLGEGVAAFVEWSREQQTPGSCSVLGFDFKTSASLAAFANGAMAHALDFEDAHDQALVHPNAAVIPAVLAVAQQLQNTCAISGQELLTAIAVGCDIVCRFGFSVAAKMDAHHWYPPPILNAFGAVAAVGKLLNLNAQQLIDAWSLALSQATCTAEIKHNSQSHIRAVRDAFPAQTAVVAAQLAQKGVRGFNKPFEGQDGFFAAFARSSHDSTPLYEHLGERFAIAELSFKPWPSCRGTHVPIELLLSLREQYQLQAADVEKIRVYSNALNRMLAEPAVTKRQPLTAIDAKFSLPYCLASALVDGEITLDSFTAQALRRADVLALAHKVDYEVDEQKTSPLMARLELELKDGRRLVLEASDALGCPARPLSDAQLVNKFHACLTHSQKDYGALADLVLRVNEGDYCAQLLQTL